MVRPGRRPRTRLQSLIEPPRSEPPSTTVSSYGDQGVAFRLRTRSRCRTAAAYLLAPKTTLVARHPVKGPTVLAAKKGVECAVRSDKARIAGVAVGLAAVPLTMFAVRKLRES